MAVAEILAQPDFELTAYERRYSIAGLDEQAHAGQSLFALQKVLDGLEQAGATSRPDFAPEPES